MKFVQLIEYNMRNIFFEKSCTKCGEETISRPFSKNQNWIYLWINSLTFYTICFYCVCMQCKTFFSCLHSSSCGSASLIRNIGEFGAKNILQTIEQLMQYMILEIQSWSLKYMFVIKIRKNLSNFPLLSKRYKAMTVCWRKKTPQTVLNVCIKYILTQIVW